MVKLFNFLGVDIFPCSNKITKNIFPDWLKLQCFCCFYMRVESGLGKKFKVWEFVVSNTNEVAKRPEHVLFEVHKEERALEEKLVKAKEAAKKTVIDAKAEASKMLSDATDARLKVELEIVEARLDKEREAKKVEVVNDEEEVALLTTAAAKNWGKTVEMILSNVLPTA